MTITLPTPATFDTPACVGSSDLFLHPLLEDASAATTAGERRMQQMLMDKAEDKCLDCPLLTKCLYTAVVEHDIAGYVAGTTPRQRAEIRARLGIKVAPEDFDTMLGVNSGRQVDHDEVVRLRAANPTESLETIANRLGCSLSTVKRHLRRARRGDVPARSRLAVVPPSPELVMTAYAEVVNGRPRRDLAA